MNAVMIVVLLITSVLAMETLYYIPVKPGDRNRVIADDFKREFMQTKLKTKDDKTTELLRNAEISVKEKKIEPFAKNQIATGWKYSASKKQLAAFEITCIKEDLREGYENENLKVGDSEYRFVDCSICLSPCSNARFYCGAQHVFCEACLKENEEKGSKGCPNCRGAYYGGELTLLGKIAHSSAGKVLQTILLIVFSVYAASLFSKHNQFLIAAVDFIFFILGRSLLFFVVTHFFGKIVLPVLNFIQPYSLYVYRRTMLFSILLYYFAAHYNLI